MARERCDAVKLWLTKLWLSSDSVNPGPREGVITRGEVIRDGKGVLVRRLAVLQVTLNVGFRALERITSVNEQTEM